MPMRNVIWTALLALAAAGCAAPTVVEPPDGGYLVQVGAVPGGVRFDPASIVEAEIVGDVLRLQVTHGGGCRDHAFSLYGGGAWMESAPVQTTVTLAHDARGDPCRAVVGRELRFDLTPLRDAYRRAYGDRGPLVIHVVEPGGPQASRHTLTYRF